MINAQSIQNHGIGISTQQYEDRIVILIDILGFKEFIKMRSCSEVLNLYSVIERFVSHGEIIKNGNVLILRPSITFFSDTIFLVFPPLEDPLNIFYSKESLWLNIQYYVNEIQLHALKLGLLIRGGIAFGKMYHNGLKWFGPALSEAYEYESKYARYPRVILTHNLAKLLDIKSKKNDFFYLGEDGLYDVRCPIYAGDKDEYDAKIAEIKKIIQCNLDKLDMPAEAKIKWQWFAQYFER